MCGFGGDLADVEEEGLALGLQIARFSGAPARLSFRFGDQL
jgi:hypothetical protein